MESFADTYKPNVRHDYTDPTGSQQENLDTKGIHFISKGIALVTGSGLGAALMYMFDPDRGKGRRALVRDKFEAVGNKANDLAGKMSRDLRNRANGAAAELRSLCRREGVADDVR